MEQTNNGTIDGVLEQLDDIIAASSRDNNPLGFFAYIYRRTTAQIKLAILEGKFEDNARMEKFDVYFANKYLQAFNDFSESKVVSSPWIVSFDLKNSNLTILQHIMLGMNAHINFDLGMAAAEFTDGGPVDDLKNDFMLVNDVLASLVDELQAKVGRVSRLMFLLDWIGKRDDEVVLNFSMEKARQQAWNFAVALSKLNGQEKKEKIEQVDGFTANLGEMLMHPPGKLLPFILKIISRFEEKDVRKIISKLES
jgi:hypothetical protein